MTYAELQNNFDVYAVLITSAGAVVSWVWYDLDDCMQINTSWVPNTAIYLGTGGVGYKTPARSIGHKMRRLHPSSATRGFG